MYVKTIDYTSRNAGKEFCHSLKETGFAILSSHPVPQDLIENVYQDWQQFFSSQEKLSYLYDKNASRQSGYFPFKSENAKGYVHKDLKEFYHYYEDKDLPKGMASHTPLLLDSMKSLGQEVLNWIEEYLPDRIRNTLSMPLKEMIDNSDMTLIRILHYPPIGPHEEGAIRAAAHEDIDLLTILPAATATGLQVKDTKGKWHDVTCDYGNLVFNAGDMLQMATKGFYKSTTHQVINPVGEAARQSRYSLPLFLHPCNSVRLSEYHTARSYLDERLTELGLRKAA